MPPVLPAITAASVPHSAPLPLAARSRLFRLLLCFRPGSRPRARVLCQSSTVPLLHQARALLRPAVPPPRRDTNSSSLPTRPLVHLQPAHTRAPDLPAALARTLRPPPG